MNDFEQFLKQQPLPRIPARWRGKILEAARARRPQEKPAQTPWWLAWLWPSPVAWAGLACVWLVILGLNAASQPLSRKTAAQAPVSPREIEAALAQQRQLVQELSRSEMEPPEPPRRRRSPGACNGRAMPIQTATV